MCNDLKITRFSLSVGETRLNNNTYRAELEVHSIYLIQALRFSYYEKFLFKAIRKFKWKVTTFIHPTYLIYIFIIDSLFLYLFIYFAASYK